MKHRTALRIFISYRRKDAKSAARDLKKRLDETFTRVFFDTASIPGGSSFSDAIRTELDRCDVVLALIGSQWLARDEKSGQSRLFDPRDFVRLELEVALARAHKRELLLIPVLHDRAELPADEQLPVSLQGLRSCQAMQLQEDGYFDGDVGRIIARLEEHAATRPPRPPFPDEHGESSGLSENYAFALMASAFVVVALVVGAFMYLRPVARPPVTPPISSDNGTAGARPPKSEIEPSLTTPKAPEAGGTNGRPRLKPYVREPGVVTTTRSALPPPERIAAVPEPGCEALIASTLRQPDVAANFFDLGKCHYDEGRYNDAVAAFNDAIERNDHKAEFFEARGLAKWKNHLAAQGITDLTSTITLAPRNGALYETRGEVYLAGRDFQRAIEDFNKATTFNSESKRAWLGLATAAEQNGDESIAAAAKKHLEAVH